MIQVPIISNLNAYKYGENLVVCHSTSTWWFVQVTVATVVFPHTKFSVIAAENIVIVRDAIVICLIACTQILIPMYATLVSMIKIILADTVLIVWLAIGHGMELSMTLTSVISYSSIRMILQSRLKQQETRMKPSNTTGCAKKSNPLPFFANF